MKQIQDIMLGELPIMLLNHEVSVVPACAGVNALHDDFAGAPTRAGSTGRTAGTRTTGMCYRCGRAGVRLAKRAPRLRLRRCVPASIRLKPFWFPQLITGG